MTAKNQEVINSFARYTDGVKTKHLFIEDNVLYSYDYHYPLCIRLSNGWVINNSGYSMTTTTHTNMLIRAVSNEQTLKEVEKNKPEHIVLMNTEKIKTLSRQIKELNINTIEDLKNFQIINNL